MCRGRRRRSIISSRSSRCRGKRGSRERAMYRHITKTCKSSRGKTTTCEDSYFAINSYRFFLQSFHILQSIGKRVRVPLPWTSAFGKNLLCLANESTAWTRKKKKWRMPTLVCNGCPTYSSDKRRCEHERKQVSSLCNSRPYPTLRRPFRQKGKNNGRKHCIDSLWFRN